MTFSIYFCGNTTKSIIIKIIVISVVVLGVEWSRHHKHFYRSNGMHYIDIVKDKTKTSLSIRMKTKRPFLCVLWRWRNCVIRLTNHRNM